MEIWKRIPGHPNYEASNLGRIKSFKAVNRNARLPINGRVLKGSVYETRGISYRHVSVDGQTFFVHRLILLTFVGPLPPGKVSRHLDSNSLNDKRLNLTYGTQAQNMQDKIKNGTWQGGENHNLCKLTNKQVFQIRRMAAKPKHKSQRAIAKDFGVHQATIWKIIHGKAWCHI